MIHLLFIPQREAHTVLVSGLAVGVNIWVTKRELWGKKIFFFFLKKLKAFLGNGFKRLSLAGTNLDTPLKFLTTGLISLFSEF